MPAVLRALYRVSSPSALTCSQQALCTFPESYPGFVENQILEGSGNAHELQETSTNLTGIGGAGLHAAKL